MKSIELYHQVAQEFPEGSQELHMLEENFLQAAWAEQTLEEHSTNQLVGYSEEDHMNFVALRGDWFRSSILESDHLIDGKNRKQYFQELFHEDPERAVAEVQALYRKTIH